MIEEKTKTVLNKFYEKEKIWNRDYYLLHIVSMLILTISMLMFIMPCQIWEGDYTLFPMIILLEFMGLEIELKRYFQFREFGKNKSIYTITKYLPIAPRDIILYALRKLLKQCLWFTGIALGCQVVFSLLFLHTVTLGNIGMPLLCCLFFPMMILGSAFLWQKE